MIITTTPTIEGKQIVRSVVGVDLDYEVIRDGMLMVTASGTAVVVS